MVKTGGEGMDLGERVLNQDKRATARLITMIENNDPQGMEILSRLYSHTGKARVIGITGPPGAGKSTLTDKLAKGLRQRNKTVGIIAVDPTSPFTGGSILGDRVRMTDLYTDPGVFIRSMGTRGHLGGLSQATLGAVRVLDLYGMDYIFIETVGVGQSEVDIVKAADTVVMVTVPGLGDDIQAIKAGILEIAHVFVINKADRDGASRTQVELEMMLDLVNGPWRPPISQAVAYQNQGIDQVLENIFAHQRYLEETNLLLENRINHLEHEIKELIHQNVMERIGSSEDTKNAIREGAVLAAKREQDPYSLSKGLLKGIMF